jgi:hypothetical protein
MKETVVLPRGATCALNKYITETPKQKIEEKRESVWKGGIPVWEWVADDYCTELNERLKKKHTS